MGVKRETSLFLMEQLKQTRMVGELYHGPLIDLCLDLGKRYPVDPDFLCLFITKRLTRFAEGHPSRFMDNLETMVMRSLAQHIDLESTWDEHWNPDHALIRPTWPTIPRLLAEKLALLEELLGTLSQNLMDSAFPIDHHKYDMDQLHIRCAVQAAEESRLSRANFRVTELKQQIAELKKELGI